jgi:hypothetical protein
VHGDVEAKETIVRIVHYISDNRATIYVSEENKKADIEKKKKVNKNMQKRKLSE